MTSPPLTVCDAVQSCAIDARHFIRRAHELNRFALLDVTARELVVFGARTFRETPFPPDWVRSFLVWEHWITTGEEPALGISPIALAERAFTLARLVEEGARGRDAVGVFVLGVLRLANTLLPLACEVCGLVREAADVVRRPNGLPLPRERRLCAEHAFALDLEVACASCGDPLEPTWIDGRFASPTCPDCGSRE